MKKKRLILTVLSVLILIGCIGSMVFLLFSNYKNVRIFKQAQSNFLQGDDASLELAETLLLQVIAADLDNEAAFSMLGEIAQRKKFYPEAVYYRYMAYRLNPLNSEYKDQYIESLCLARYFDRLEIFLSTDRNLLDKNHQLLFYAAGRNGNINKYKTLLERRNNDNSIGELALLLFEHKFLTNQEKLAALEKIPSSNNAFLQQEIYVAQTEIYLATQDIDRAEKSLLQAYELNQFAFAPALGRFYANYRNFGKALEIFEKHLATYHDQSVAIQAAELYCLLNQTDKIAKLRADYQSDSGNRAMLCNYYFDALMALAQKDMTVLKDFTAPLRNTLDTPLSAFMFFCTDIQSNNLASIQTSYKNLLAHRNYLDLQNQADNILSEYLKKSFNSSNHDQEKLLALATLLYSRKPEVFTAKLMLLAQKNTNSVNIVLLKDALKRFSGDQGIIKIAIEYYLANDLAEAERLIEQYKQSFIPQASDMFRYEIILNLQKKDYNRVSELFRQNFKPEIRSEYWVFASSTMREDDLIFLSKDKIYEPFCLALLDLKKGNIRQACDRLETADAGANQDLLFFAAKILAENGRNQAALKKYVQFPKNSPYKVVVGLNMAELYAEIDNLDQALQLSAKAYNSAPHMPESQLCYADKLYRANKLSDIPDIVNLSSSPTLRSKMEPLWVAGMEQRIKDCNINTQREKIRELCRQLLVIAPENNIALEYLKKLHQMPQ